MGILGFLLYLGVFLIAAYFSVKLLFKSNLKPENRWFIFLLTSALGVYFIDANLNFPIARPQVLAPWAMTMAINLLLFIIKIKNLKKNQLSSTLIFIVSHSCNFTNDI